MSLTLTSLIVLVIDTLAKWANVSSLDQNAIVGFITTIVWVGSVFGVWLGRYRQGDNTWYGKTIK